MLIKNKIREKTKNLSKPRKTLPQKMVQGGAFISSLKIIRKVLSLIRLVVIGRILAPSDFGLMGIALLTMSALETFSTTGFSHALIQKKENTHNYLDAAWTVLIMRGFIVFIMLYLAAPYVAVFFHSPAVRPIIQVLGFTTFIHAFSNIGVVFFQKELEFNKVFIYRFVGISTNFIVAILAALILRNVWALVLGLFAENVVNLIVSYLIHPYRPRFSKDFGKAKELFGFGRWVLGSNILIFIGEHIDDIFVGRVLSAMALGFYQMAYRISNMLETEITQVISSVAFPAYAKIQDQKVRLQKAYFRIMRLTLAISLPITAGMVLLAPEFTQIFLGEKWIPMVKAMQLLAVAGLIKSVVSTGSPLFTGSGYPNYEFYMQLIRGFIILLVIYPLIELMGISGAAIGVILSVAGMLIIWYPFSQKIIRVSWHKYFDTFWPPLFCSLIMAGSIYIAKLYWNPIQQPLGMAILMFVTVVVMSVCVYIAAMYLLQRCYSKYDILNEVKFFYKSLVKR
ncbi:MAG TPA: lipopolysaccharide biosynthesis protein [Candidatus Atribacteria bacterium]|nr:lipopolysaccharide biosynthesis protein [Candidatus Atribacteria bacterium]